MTASDFGSIASALVALAALAYSYFQSYLQSGLKKYEIKRDYVSRILDWYTCTIRILIELRCLLIHDKTQFHKVKLELLSKLSAQIELGRFYFPNIDKADGYGKDKPKAYRGYRNLTLDFLVYNYDIFLKENPEKYLDHLEVIQREFTSIVFEIIDPNEIIKETSLLTDKFYIKNWSFEEYLKGNPDKFDIYLARYKD